MNLFGNVIWAALHYVAILLILLLLVERLAPKLPTFISEKVADWHWVRGMRTLGPYAILVRDEDGIWELFNAEYDRENDCYWAIHSDGFREPFPAEGVEDAPGHLYGMRTVVAYRGIGNARDLAADEIDVESVVVDPGFTKPSPGVGSFLNVWLGDVKARLGRDDQDRAVADGGVQTVEMGPVEIRQELEEAGYLKSLGTQVVVDLRDTLYSAPFHVRPEAFHRMAKNAQKEDVGAILSQPSTIIILLVSFVVGGLLVWFVNGAPGL